MGANFNPDDIYQLIRDRRLLADPYSQVPVENDGDEPHWLPPLTTGDLLEDADESQDGTDSARSNGAQSDYTTASTVTSETSTMRSTASRSDFSGRYGHRNTTHITTPTEYPHNPLPSFEQQFQAPSAAPARPDQILWCEFSGLLNCTATFRLDEEREWIQHHVDDHLGNRFPQTLMCWFCDYVPFVAQDPSNVFANFVDRMQHVRDHILRDYYASANTRRDLHLAQHLHEHGTLDDRKFEVAMQYEELPDVYRLTGDHSFPTSSSSYQQPLGQDGVVGYHDLRKEERERRRKPREAQKSSRRR
ncbi:uncharacterized protein B0H64DRAFT_213958 [Chaetomium fimeti]|jgi:hypothetical protein|uniref:Uncharacterized protein n=1 Tax=Chaetomium fimeti TaxID=1854472 RepID=A0AAE0HBF4_9PEZI|nr:hypothetical protein B0H64DRAFT_213958 [Chaetomium fimeti]